MMSDWFSCFFFTEGVRGFRCWFLMIVFHGLACISLWSFATAIYGKPKCNSVHYLHNSVVNLVLILVNSLLLDLFNSVQLCSFSSIHKESSNPKMWNLQMKSKIWIMKTGLEMESRIKQDCSSKVKIIRTLSSDSFCVLLCALCFFVFVFVCFCFFCRESSPLCFTISISLRSNKRDWSF